MAYLTISEARASARNALFPLQKSASRALTEEAQAFSIARRYDIFLSHSYDDAEIIYGVKKTIESVGLTVYVDWIDDAKLDRSKVTVTTATLLRDRMKTCSSLVYAHSANSSNSVWMPWELGYFDGFKPEHVWILPIVAYYDGEFQKQEYLALYPSVEKLTDLHGLPSLGFTNVGNVREQILLATAARGAGVFLRG